MFNNSKKILATITWMFSLLPREAFQDPHPTVPICVIYGDHKMLQLSIYLTAICIRNMQSRHASVSSCFWHKTELLPCQKDVFFLLDPLCSSYDQSVTHKCRACRSGMCLHSLAIMNPGQMSSLTAYAWRTFQSEKN
jgi:hypothetical protein